MTLSNQQFTKDQITNEANRLFEQLKRVGRTFERCLEIAPLTLRINKLKKTQDAVILAHSYQIPEIMYGVADFIGDSYGLSKIAATHPAKTIVFCSVHFMGETAKLLSPEKEVLVPAVAGCSLAQSITAEDVRGLRRKHPGIPVVCYINTDAAVKAESDIVCTSSNALRIVDSMETDEVIFIPDMLMGKNLQAQTKKKLILWHGTCIVHERFDEETIKKVKNKFPDTKILVHYECNSAVAGLADLVGSTGDILDYVKTTDAEHVMVVTECGITDRLKLEVPEKQIVGTCQLCPYMKQITLENVLQALEEPRPDQVVKIPEEVLVRAKQSIDRMMEMSS